MAGGTVMPSKADGDAAGEGDNCWCSFEWVDFSSESDRHLQFIIYIMYCNIFLKISFLSNRFLV